MLAAVPRVNQEGLLQIGELALALALSATIGLEREIRQKSAGLRTHTLVGVGAALFMLISKYGFNDVVANGVVSLDPSRMAAQIVSGVGFLGAGLIFVRSDAVRGLTTAAAVWVTAAIGCAAGAGLPVLAVATTGMYLLVTLVFTPLSRALARLGTGPSVIQVRYPDGRGMLREMLKVATERGFTIDRVQTEQTAGGPLVLGPDGGLTPSRPTVVVTLHVRSKAPIHSLAAALSELDEVEAVIADQPVTVGD